MDIMLRLLALCTCLMVPLVGANVFPAGDRRVSVLADSSVLVPFSPNTDNLTVTSCYFEYTNLAGLQEEEFVGYHITNAQRLNMTNRHQGWNFINRKYPCKCGIRRDTVRQYDVGRYRMFVNNLTPYSSPYVTVKLYKEADLKIKANTEDGGSEEERQLKDLRLNSDGVWDLPDIKGVDGTQREFSISLSDKFPEDTKISFSKVSKDAHGKEVQRFLTSCTNQIRCSVQFVLGEESDVVVTATLNTTIQDYPVISVVQRYSYNGVHKTSGHKAAIAILILLILAGILAVLGYVFRDKIRKLIRRIRNKDTKADVEAIESLNPDKDAEKDSLRKQIKELTNQNRELEKEKNDLNIEVQVQKAKTKDQESEAKGREELLKENATLKIDKDNLRQSNKQLEDNNKSLMFMNEKLTKENADRRKQLQEKGMPDFVRDPESVVVSGDQKEVTITAEIIGKDISVSWKKNETVDVNKPKYDDITKVLPHQKSKPHAKAIKEGNVYRLCIPVAPKYYGEYVCVASNKAGNADRSFSVVRN